jgi:HSP20 family protein
MNRISNCAPSRANNKAFVFNSPFGSLFDDAFFGREFASHVPAVNIHQTDKAWTIEVFASGFSKEQFQVKLEKEILTISGEIEKKEPEEKKNYSRREFNFGSFSRQFNLDPQNIQADAIAASYENGILAVNIPKKEIAEQKTAREIKIG